MLIIENRLKVYIEILFESKLKVVMVYVLFGGGKCIRFMLGMILFESKGVDLIFYIEVFLVVEMIYIYLFIYDDFFVMDDDILRCGKLIVYIVFDEVIVILVGDVFLIDSFRFVI